MLDKTTKRLRLLVLMSALAGVAVAVAGNLFVSSAQWEGYNCPARYHTCYMDPLDPWGTGGGDTGGGGGGSAGGCDSAGGVWKCTGSTSSDGTTGPAACTIAGCRRYSESYPVQVCNYIPSDPNTRCPPLDVCECR